MRARPGAGIFRWRSRPGRAMLRPCRFASASSSTGMPAGFSRGRRDPAGQAAGAPALGLADGRAPLSRLPAAGGPRPALRGNDRWLGLAAWQNGAFKCAPRDRWCGWRPEQWRWWRTTPGSTAAMPCRSKPAFSRPAHARDDIPGVLQCTGSDDGRFPESALSSWRKEPMTALCKSCLAKRMTGAFFPRPSFRSFPFRQRIRWSNARRGIPSPRARKKDSRLKPS